MQVTSCAPSSTPAPCPILVLSPRNIWSIQSCIVAGGVPDPQLGKFLSVFANNKSKQAASFDLAVMKQNDLSWTPEREAKMSKTPRSLHALMEHVGHVRAPRFSGSRLGTQPADNVPKDSRSRLARCLLIILQSHRAYCLQSHIPPLSRGSKAHIEKVAPLAICFCAQTLQLEDKQTWAGSPWESCVRLFPACFICSMRLFRNQTAEDAGS